MPKDFSRGNHEWIMINHFVHVAVTNFAGGEESGSVLSAGFGMVAEGTSQATRVGCGVVKGRHKHKRKYIHAVSVF